MHTQLTRRLALLTQEEHRPLLSQGLRGIERETLRIDPTGKLAASAHPIALGSTLTHAQITTDYAEALLEFITPTDNDIATTLEKLNTIHRVAYSALGSEMLWSQSMPSILPAEADIQIAWYGKSHIGMLKHVYRRGLALRYGKAMQCIAGIHYNYSLPEKLWSLLKREEDVSGTEQDFQSESYIALIRNFRRYSWLLMYLFGASPALSRCFLQGRDHQLERLSEDTLYLPYATSLRMSDLGYQNDAQSGLRPQENSLENYVKTLSDAVSKPYPPYARFGIKNSEGEWIQLSTNILQIENEYYSTIRPKRVIRSGERPIQALCGRGVQYIEVRCMDVDPFEPIGINLETSRFLDVFLLFCALDASPAISAEESREQAANFALTVKEGRRPGLSLLRQGEAIHLQEWGQALLAKMQAVAELLDQEHGTDSHARSMQAQLQKLQDATLTPSARVLQAMGDHGDSFHRFGLHQSEQHAAYFKANPPNAGESRYFKELADSSLAETAKLEQEQTGNFDDYVAAYLASSLCKSLP
ncbi:glutamate--cysteine ligase [Undibacterium sp. Jales W-56]|uniref:glutamate--cysteine ligase n=1 Tax=Undibacterium sp. Jales W-56 TaxID=2897325 RepID=UPI0021CFD252|nr:glutamate--cysteine ligase [Undibacterium sp. Jales W-56]MCU6432575.1 glutamate--cysteine ligase [Undibacterium sp. Jales W-56]